MKECLMYGFLGGFLGSLYMGWIGASKPTPCPPPNLAVIDIPEILSKKAEHLVQQFSPSPQTATVPTNTARIQEAGNRLKDDLRAFATTHNLILLAKNAVVGDTLPDKTAEFLALLEEQERS